MNYTKHSLWGQPMNKYFLKLKVEAKVLTNLTDPEAASAAAEYVLGQSSGVKFEVDAVSPAKSSPRIESPDSTEVEAHSYSFAVIEAKDPQEASVLVLLSAKEKTGLEYQVVMCKIFEDADIRHVVDQGQQGYTGNVFSDGSVEFRQVPIEDYDTLIKKARELDGSHQEPTDDN